MEGDELYIEMRDKLSVEEDLLFDNSERQYKFGLI